MSSRDHLVDWWESKGIQFDESHYVCLLCAISYCQKCQDMRLHPQSHLSHIKSIKCRLTPQQASRDVRICTGCSRPVHCRVGCGECDISLCYDCYPDAEKRKILEDHLHEIILDLRSPDNVGLPRYWMQCAACESGNCVAHCTRCSKGVKHYTVCME